MAGVAFSALGLLGLGIFNLFVVSTFSVMADGAALPNCLGIRNLIFKVFKPVLVIPMRKISREHGFICAVGDFNNLRPLVVLNNFRYLVVLNVLLGCADAQARTADQSKSDT